MTNDEWRMANDERKTIGSCQGYDGRAGQAARNFFLTSWFPDSFLPRDGENAVWRVEASGK
jgi:hypothetical protein